MRWSSVRCWYGEDERAIPDLSHTGCGAARDALIHSLTVADKDAVRIPSASSRRDKCLSPPTYFCTAGSGSSFKDQIPSLGLLLICFSLSRMCRVKMADTHHMSLCDTGMLSQTSTAGRSKGWLHCSTVVELKHCEHADNLSVILSPSVQNYQNIQYVLVSLIRWSHMGIC